MGTQNKNFGAVSQTDLTGSLVPSQAQATQFSDFHAFFEFIFRAKVTPNQSERIGIGTAVAAGKVSSKSSLTYLSRVVVHLSESKGDVTRDDSQRRFLVQYKVAMLEQCCNYSKQCRNNVANRR